MAVSTTSAPTSSNAMLGIAWKLASVVVFTAMLGLVKYASERIPVGEILFARNFFGIIPVVIFLAWQGSIRRALVTKSPGGHFKRAMTGVLAMGLWFVALERLSLPEATAIIYAAPLIMVVFAALILGERVRIYRWTAVSVGFAGVLVIVAPQLTGSVSLSDAAMIGVVCALAAAVFMALTSVFVRQLVATESTATIVLYFFLAASVVSLVSLPFGWVVPSWHDLFILVLIGVIGGVGQLMVTTAFHHAEASIIAPLEYTSIIWATGIGYFFFAEVPRVATMFGAAIVIASGIFVIYRERRLGRVRHERKMGAPMRS
jgi:drug/metabolite transporter (DMT)-like permease